MGLRPARRTGTVVLLAPDNEKGRAHANITTSAAALAVLGGNRLASDLHQSDASSRFLP